MNFSELKMERTLQNLQRVNHGTSCWCCCHVNIFKWWSDKPGCDQAHWDDFCYPTNLKYISFGWILRTFNLFLLWLVLALELAVVVSDCARGGRCNDGCCLLGWSSRYKIQIQRSTVFIFIKASLLVPIKQLFSFFASSNTYHLLSIPYYYCYY